MEQPTDYDTTADMPEGAWRFPARTDRWLLAIWTCIGLITGWVACMYWYGILLFPA